MRNFFLLLSMLLSMTSKVFAFQDSISIAEAIELNVLQSIKPLIPEGKAYVIVSLSGSNTEQTSEVSLPYLAVTVDIERLKKIVNRNFRQFETLNFSVDLAIDESIPEASIKLVERKIRSELAIDDSNRTLKIEVLSITNDSFDPTRDVPENPSEVEVARLQLERNKIEMEREKLDSLRKETQLTKALEDQKKEFNERIAELQKQAPEESSAQPGQQEEKSTLDLIKDFQFLILAVIVGILALMAAVIVSGSHLKGLSAMSAAMENISGSLSSTGDSAANVSDSSGISTSVSATAGESSGVSGSAGIIEAGSFEDEKMRLFIELVEEKIQVLVRDKNFLFLQYFVDIIRSKPSYAGAILVSLNDELAKMLVDSISIEELELVKEFMLEEDALVQAQAFRQEALKSFYGRMVVDEYSNSPLLKLNGIDWLYKLTNQQLVELTLALGEDDQVVFLACFTPARIASMLEKTEESSKASLIHAVRQIDELKNFDLEAVFTRAEAKYLELSVAFEEKVQSLIDAPRFYADIIKGLPGEDRNRMLSAIEEKEDLMQAIKRYYIRFEEIRHIEDHLVRSLFSKRPANQLALIALTAPEDIQTIIIGSVPEALQETVQEDLERLKSNERQKVQNIKKSQQLHDEVSAALLRMNKEGLLTYKPKLSAIDDDLESAS